ncbi:MAG: PepSY domain-containing protein [Microscillaceae bacterium]|jgi:cytochrome b561|nr:PepSY domain-containing protein [Microscillaceae bacterium]
MENNSSVLFQETQNINSERLTKPSGSKINRFLKRNIYNWHKIIGLITIIPVILWTLSGLMHPFMAHWFKPTIAKEFLMPQPLAKNQIKLSVQEVLEKNKLKFFKNFRLVSMQNQTYYQIKNNRDKLLYFNALDGKELSNGDKVYAEFLARYFLNDKSSQIKSITLQTEFDQQYKYINRLLPVWKLTFDRPDQMDIYIETSSSRLGTYNPTVRKAFLWVFDNFHNWALLDFIPYKWLKISIMLILLGIIMASAVSGVLIYGLLWKKFKKPASDNKKGILLQYHRQIGIATALVTLTFAFSGAYHLTRKLEPNRLPEMAYSPILKTQDLQIASLDLNVDWERLSNLSVIKKGKNHYFQAFYTKNEEKPAEVVYFDAEDGKVWQKGNELYARFLANKFANALANVNTSGADCCEPSLEIPNADLSEANLLKINTLTAFDKREYGFVFKRLPVVQLAYDTPQKDSYFIETATSHLAAHVSNADRYEGYSFAIFHKFLFLEWAGKDVRDIATMLSALGVLVVALFGLAVFLRR